MAGPSPNTLSISKIKSNLLNLAQTSVYQVKLSPPADVQSFLSQEGRNFSYLLNGESIELLCSDTNLPGSSLATHDVTNDYPGVTEKFAYRRIYDETIDFTFYVDSDYKVIEFLDGWINYITGQGTTFSNDQYVDRTKYYRMNYSNLYKTDGLYITKFEKDTSNSMTYQFIGAFPVNIVSMPVSYEASNILKCTASFSYIRYIRKRSNRKPDSSSGIAGSSEIAASSALEQAAINGRFLGPPQAKTFLGQPLNSQQTLNELYAAGRSGRIKSAGEFIGPLQ
jgi:hypothetical protein